MKKPAFVTAELEVTDPAGFQAYMAKVPDTLKRYNAQVIVRAKPESKEGAAPRGNIVIAAFGSLADAGKWYSTPPYSDLIPMRQKAAKSVVHIVEGVPK